MAAYTFKKFTWHTAICLAVWIVVDRFSPEGRLYAGFMTAFLGSCYLLAGWLSYLKSKGTDVLAGSGAGRHHRYPISTAGIRHRNHRFGSGATNILLTMTWQRPQRMK